MARKKIKRVTYTNKKTGKKTYYYYEMDGKKTVRKATAKEWASERGGKKRKSLTWKEAQDYLKSKSATFEEIQMVYNEYLGDASIGKRSKTFTKQSLDGILENIKADRTENFLRQLGYNFEEFEDEFHYSKQFVKEHGFEDIGNGVYMLRGTNLSFIWDYDGGIMRR